MATAVQMPQMGESVVEGTILKWLKAEGDKVAADESLVEVSTDKVDTEIPSPISGTLTKILVQEGAAVEVGTAICEVDEDGAGAAKPADGKKPAEAKPEPAEAEAKPSEAKAAQPEAEAKAAQPEAEAKPAQPEAEAKPAQPEAEAKPAHPEAEAKPDASPAVESKALSPLVRRLAREHNVDLSQVSGTGAAGRITKQDVENFIHRKPATAPSVQHVPPAAAAGRGTDETQPFSHIRKSIAKHMVKSLQTSARAWNAVEVDMENIVRLRNKINPSFKATNGFSLTYLPFICRATVDALATVPLANASVSEDLSEAILHHYVNIGIAVATDYGLIVPVVKGAESMNVIGLAKAIRELAEKARTKNLSPDDVGGSTFTITNPGPFGSYLSVPVINQPNVAILATEGLEQRVVAVDGMIAIRHRMFLSMSWDHRLLDGSDAMQFIAKLKANLESWDFTSEVTQP